jgi:hypothetical protein
MVVDRGSRSDFVGVFGANNTLELGCCVPGRIMGATVGATRVDTSTCISPTANHDGAVRRCLYLKSTASIRLVASVRRLTIHRVHPNFRKMNRSGAGVLAIPTAGPSLPARHRDMRCSPFRPRRLRPLLSSCLAPPSCGSALRRLPELLAASAFADSPPPRR